MTREREKMKGYRPRGPETSEGLKIPNVTSSIIVDTPKEHQEHYEKDTEIEILEVLCFHLLVIINRHRTAERRTCHFLRQIVI